MCEYNEPQGKASAMAAWDRCLGDGLHMERQRHTQARQEDGFEL